MTSNLDLINRTELRAIYERWILQLTAPEDAGDRTGVETCLAVLNDAPAVKPIEAHWIYSPCDGVWTTACSHCGYEETGENMRKYKGCPMCRAKMTHIECVGHRKEIKCRINSANGFNQEGNA